MANKKYELTEESISLGDTTLFRIKALKDFNDISKGDLGGYIEKESNLSQYGNCWVYGNAKVYNDAWVSGNAQVYDNTQISDDAWVSGNAQVYDNTQISDDAKVFDNAKIYGNTKIFGNAIVYDNAQIYRDSWPISPFYLTLSSLNIMSCSYTDLKIGCQVHSIEKWKKHGEKIGKENGYSDYEIELYKETVKLAEKHIELAKKEAQNGRTRKMACRRGT